MAGTKEWVVERPWVSGNSVIEWWFFVNWNLLKGESDRALSIESRGHLFNLYLNINLLLPIFEILMTFFLKFFEPQPLLEIELLEISLSFHLTDRVAPSSFPSTQIHYGPNALCLHNLLRSERRMKENCDWHCLSMPTHLFNAHNHPPIQGG